MEKINVAELLKCCPSGMELDCTMFDDVYFDYVDELNIIHCYIQHETSKTSITFNQHGSYNSYIKSKCVIFPKGKTTWEGFVPPYQFKDGDIAVSDIGDIHLLRTKDSSYCAYRERLEGASKLDKTITTSVRVERLATEEEKQKLFDIIKANGYKWNPETKTLESKFKDGDVITCNNRVCTFVSIFKNKPTEKSFIEHCSVILDNNKFIVGITYADYANPRFATEEEKIKLFQAIKDNGYKWNEETKTLENLIKPNFKVGNRIRSKKNNNYIYTITGIREKENKYECGVTFVLRFSEQDDWELVPNKFNINTLRPFDKVLMRSSNAREWVATFYSHYSNNKFYGCGMCCDQCIPYKGNEHLLGTTDDCDEFYK